MRLSENNMDKFIKRLLDLLLALVLLIPVWGIERSGFFNGREKWAKGFENQRV